jgi:tripartite-type tricarboxylate transporter receptor subunit TctC
MQATMPNVPNPMTRRQALALAASLASPVWAQGLGDQRPINLVVPFAPGGIADLTARAVAQAMATAMGQPVLVDNRPSAGSIVASQAVAGAVADGHTMLLMSNGHAVAPSLFKKLPYDAQKDFAPVCLLAQFELGLFAPTAGRIASLAQLLDLGRKQPGRLTVGTVAVGSTQHLAALWFLQLAGIEALVVPYKGTPGLLAALRGGDVDVAFEILGPWLPQASAGALRVLATTGKQRATELAQVPTVAEVGAPALARYEVHSWNGLAVPARTPIDVVVRLNLAANNALKHPAVANQLRALGVRALGGSPENLRQWLASETRHWADVVSAAKIEST